jgi:hypothetical protein
LLKLGISTTISSQGVVGSIVGSASSNLTICDSVFEANGSGNGVVGSSSVTTLGGVVYIEAANNVELDNCTFQQISSIGSGGGLYINSSSSVNVKNSVFNQIVVSISGGFCCCVFITVFVVILRHMYIVIVD